MSPLRSHRRVARAGVVLAGFCVLFVGHAGAQEPPRARLIWEAPDGCLGEASLRTRVTALLTDERSRRIRGRFESGDTWTAVLTVEAPDGSELGIRRVVGQGATCDSLDESVALVVAMLVEAMQHDVTLSVPPAHRSARGGLALAWRVSAGLAGDPAFGGTVSLSWIGPDHIGVRVDVNAQWGVVGFRAGDFRLMAADLGLMAVAELDFDAAWGSVLAAGVRSGFLWAESTGFDVNRTVLRPTLAPVARASLRWRALESLSLHFGIEALVPIFRDRLNHLSESGRTTVHEMAPVAGAAFLGLELNTPL